MTKNFCEFFTGIGLTRLALAKTNWMSMYANNYKNIICKELYKDIHGSNDSYHTINNLTTDINIDTSNIFMATAVLPNSDIKDRKITNRLRLFSAFSSAIAKKKPPVILLTCPPSLIATTAISTQILEQLSTLGYKLNVVSINSSLFVPQSHKQIYIIGTTSAALLSNLHKSIDIEYKSIAGHPYYNVLRVPHKPITIIDIVDKSVPWWPQARTADCLRKISIKNLNILLDGNDKLVIAKVNYREGMRCLETRFDGMVSSVIGHGPDDQVIINVEKNKVSMRNPTPSEHWKLRGMGDTINCYNVGGAIQFVEDVCVLSLEWVDMHILTPLYNNY